MSKKIKIWVMTKSECCGGTDIWDMYSSFEKGKQDLLDMFNKYNIEYEEYINDESSYGRWESEYEDVYRLSGRVFTIDGDVEEITDDDTEGEGAN